MTPQPKEHVEASPREMGDDDYRTFCELVGLKPIENGYGLLLCDDDGRHVTVVTTDVEYHRTLVGAGHEIRAGLTVPAGKYPLRRAGWPDEWGNAVDLSYEG